MLTRRFSLIEGLCCKKNKKSDYPSERKHNRQKLKSHIGISQDGFEALNANITRSNEDIDDYYRKLNKKLTIEFLLQSWLTHTLHSFLVVSNKSITETERQDKSREITLNAKIPNEPQRNSMHTHVGMGFGIELLLIILQEEKKGGVTTDIPAFRCLPLRRQEALRLALTVRLLTRFELPDLLLCR